MLASIVMYDEYLAIENEDESDTGAGIRECCLSVFVAEANEATLSPQHYAAISEIFGAHLGDTSGLRRVTGDRLGHITQEDLEQLCKHLTELRMEDMNFLLDWTRAHCGPKLKWEQCIPFRSSAEGLQDLESFPFG